jgi:hypothetical protein
VTTLDFRQLNATLAEIEADEPAKVIMTRARPAGRRRRSRIVTSLLIVALLPHVLRTEEASPSPRAYPKVPAPDGLLPDEQKYMDWVDDYVPWLVRVARRHLIRHQILMYASGISALAIPLAIALRAPDWTPAGLAFIAAVGQFAQAAGQDQKLYILHHEQASKIQKARRDFGFDTTAGGYPQNIRERFNRFRQTVEQTKHDSGVQTLRIKGQEPEAGHSGTKSQE